MKIIKKHRNVLYEKRINRNLQLDTNPLTTYYFVSKQNQLIDKEQIQASRVVITREMRKSKVNSRKSRVLWIYPNFSVPFTKKGAQSRMGKGKGGIDSYKSNIQINDLIFKIRKINSISAKAIALRLSRKLAFDIEIIRQEKNSSNRLTV